MDLLEIEIERYGLLQTRIGLDGLDEGKPLAGHQIADRHRARNELGEIDTEPFGQRGVEIENLALAPGGEETGGSMVEIVDRILQLLEEALLIVPLRRNVADLPDAQRLAAAFFALQNAVPSGDTNARRIR